MRSNRLMAVAGAIFLAGVAAIAEAQTPHPVPQGEAPPRADANEGRHDRGRRAEGRKGQGPRGEWALLRGIELTEEQRTQLREIRERHRTEMLALRERVREQRKAAPEGQRVRPDSVALAAARQLMDRQRSEVRAVLTPEQQARFDANVAEMRERMEQRRGERRHRGHRGGSR